MKILITGETGFIGKHLHKELKHKFKSAEIRCVSRNSNDMDLDLSQVGDVQHLYSVFQPDFIFHLAGNANPKPDNSNFDQILKNINATYNLVHLCPKEARFIFASTILVYGTVYDGHKPVESDRESPISMYGLTKLTSEHIINIYNRLKKIKGISIRLPAVVGSGLTHGMLHDFIKKLLSDSPKLEILGNHPGSIKPYVHVDDVVALMIDMMNIGFNEYNNWIYNAVNEDIIDVETVAHNVMKVLNIKKPVVWNPAGNWSTDVFRVDARNSGTIVDSWRKKYPTSISAIKGATLDIKYELNI